MFLTNYIKNLANIYVKYYEDLLDYFIKNIQLLKEIKKNRAYIFLIENLKIYYSYPNKTPKYNGFFVISYNKENNLSIPLKNTDIDFILVVFNDGFYLIPVYEIPISKNDYICRGFRLYKQSLFENFFISY